MKMRLHGRHQFMDVFEAIQQRRSVRVYKPTPVSKKKLNRILKGAQMAPSAGNVQPWHFIVVTDSEKRKKLAEGGTYAKFLVKSPVAIVGCGDQAASPKWHMVDVTIALEHLVLAATSEGLGTCWVGSFEENQVKQLLRIPDNFRVVALLALGYPSESLDLQKKVTKTVRRRKELAEIVSYEEYSE